MRTLHEVDLEIAENEAAQAQWVAVSARVSESLRREARALAEERAVIEAESP